MNPRKRLDHEMPYWVDAVPDYFLTICADPRGRNHLCRPDIGPAVLESIKVYNEKGNWHCEVAVLMPDHLHLLVSIPPDKILSKVVGLWKRALAKSHKISWQRNFFDHRLRSDANAQLKSDYVLQNPVRAGLIDDAMKWAYMWMPHQ